MEELIPYAAAVVASILIGKYIYIWYAEIDKRNKLLEAQIRLLSHIALKQGVDSDVVASVVAGAGIKSINGDENQSKK